ncbi:MAG TPA: SRPBCC domain-containing protein [Thermoleophilaceae bacterium]|nr:SRPBCC domain-containing protein [Thermoleophilaceae bacterium]
MAERREIAMTREYDAPREEVWAAWTEPARLATWWGKRGWHVDPATVEMDVRPGGRFALTSEDARGNRMPQSAVYREVVAPERLVIDEPAADNWHGGAVTTVTFTDLGDGRTRMEFRASIATTEEMAQTAAGGVADTLDRLGEHLTTTEHTEEQSA